MKENKLFTIERQQELILINRWLAYSVVVLITILGFIYFKNFKLIRNTKPEPLINSQIIPSDSSYEIPPASPSGLVSIAMKTRWHRSIDKKSLQQDQLWRILWLAQGKITTWGERTIPSFKAAFPVDLLVEIRSVQGLKPGMYAFDAKQQRLIPDTSLKSIVLPEEHPGLLNAPVVLYAYTKNYQDQMAYVESGAISQEILLGLTEMDLVSYMVSPDLLPEDSLKSLLIRTKELLWIMPVGYLDPAANK